MARIYSEKDRENEERKIIEQRKNFDKKAEWQKEIIKEREKTAAEVSNVINKSLDMRESDTINNIKLRGGNHGAITRVPDPASVYAETMQGDAIFLTPAERFGITFVMNAKKELEFSWNFKLEDGREVDGLVYAKKKLIFYIDGKKVSDEDLSKKLSDHSNELKERAKRDIDNAIAKKGIDPGEEVRKQFVKELKNKREGIER